MAYADRVKDSTTTTGTGAITLANSAPTGYQTFAAGLPAASTVPYCISSQSTAEWEVGNGVLLTGTTLSRSPTASSNAGGLVNFSAGTKDVFCTLPAASITKLLSSDDIAFSTAIPFTAQGIRYMPQQTVASVLAFTAAASPVKNSQVYVRLLADATNVPTFTGMKEWGGSLGYDNRSLIANQITFWYDGYDYWYSISQAVGAVPTPAAVSGITMTGPTGGIVSTASSAFTVGVTPVGGTITGTIIVTPSDASGGGTFTPTSLSLSTGTVSGTFTYTPNATVAARTISVTNNQVLTNPSNITYTTTAAATAPGAPTIGTATATGATTATVTFTAPGSDGGSAITSYTATSSPGGFTGTLSGATAGTITVSGLTVSTAYTFTVTATNAINTSSASSASNSVTTSSSAVPMRFANLASTTESGTSPYTYTGTGGAFGSAIGGVGTTSLQSGIDGSAVIKVNAYTGTSNELMFALGSQTTPTAFANLPVMFYTQGSSGRYEAFISGTDQGVPTNTVAPAVNDLMRLTRTGTTVIAAVSKDSGATYTTIFTFTGVATTATHFHIQLSGSGSVIGGANTGLA